ncbi:MAG: TIGR01212 family radical SAM protein [Planctomycetes bacterium]|nr:TIGR01212 family radical SAM protein [Planctomycetota bacterium]
MRPDPTSVPAPLHGTAGELGFRTLRPWLAARFGRTLHRVALDAGSDCPNRDGSKGRGGCAYCDVEGSGTGALKSGVDLASQLRTGIERVRKRDPDCRVVAYFQSYSNTYVEPARLDEVLAVLEPHLQREIGVVALATRPDTLPDWALARLARLAERVEVWLELGLEAADDAILAAINRHHSVADFRGAVERAQAHGLLVVGHAILGLPGDGRAGARRTAEVLAACGCAGIKVHQLMVLRRTIFEKRWRAGEIETLDERAYVEWLADFVERLRPEQVLHRITGDAPDADLLAPRWELDKNDLRNRLADELRRRGTRQGSRAN